MSSFRIRYLGIGLLVLLLPSFVSAQRKPASTGKVCGDPTIACASRTNFNDDDIPFEHGRNYAVAESERFYIVILKSYSADSISGADGRDGCEIGPPDADRTSVQYTFKRNKVFFARGCYSIENNYYTNIDERQIALAVYAGRTRAEADRLLASAKKSGYKDAFVKRITTGFNGT